MTVLYASLAMTGAFAAGCNAAVMTGGKATPINGAGLVAGIVTGIYFMARSHGWAP